MAERRDAPRRRGLAVSSRQAFASYGVRAAGRASTLGRRRVRGATLCQSSPSSGLHKILQPDGRRASVSTVAPYRRVVYGGTDFDDHRERHAECRAGAECCTSWSSRGADAPPPADGHRGFLRRAFSRRRRGSRSPTSTPTTTCLPSPLFIIPDLAPRRYLQQLAPSFPSARDARPCRGGRASCLAHTEGVARLAGGPAAKSHTCAQRERPS